MNLKSFSALVLTLAASLSASAQITEAHIAQARNLVSKMTLDEKIRMISGKTRFSTADIPRLGIPEILMADGPQGIRNHCEHSTLYPAGIMLAATWNRDIAKQYGASLGNDARARGVSILLGPGVNIYRSPMCGRNFEYMGEDPYLASEIALNYILGVQSEGVIATIKHFAGNNQEWSRHHASSDIDERTLHEIYFPTFRKAVTKGEVGAVMNSYNLLNGVHASENKWLNTEILRNQWGFKGILMSDWNSVYSTTNAVASGLDLEMPKGIYFTPEKIKSELASGRITTKMIDAKVEHILSTYISKGLLDKREKTSIPLDNPKSRAVALATAREGVVLLKNEGNILPLKGKTVVLGPNCDTIVSGGGSGAVSPFSVSPVTRALKSIRKNTTTLPDTELYTDLNGKIYADSAATQLGFKGTYYSNKKFKGKPAIVRIDPVVDFKWGYESPDAKIPNDEFSISWEGYYFPTKDGIMKLYVCGDDGYRVKINGKVVAEDWGNHSTSSREVQYPIEKGKRYDIVMDYFDTAGGATAICNMAVLDSQKLERELRKADNVVYCTGFNGDVEGEGFDRAFALPKWQEEMIQKIASINPNLVLVLNSGGNVDMSRWGDLAKGVVMGWYPGQEGGTAIAEILAGKLSPSGKLPISMEAKIEDNPAAANYYDNRFPEKPIRSAATKECAHAEYREGVFVGYRGYDRTGVKPLYPFGYGLSYTDFKFSDLELTPLSDGNLQVSFTVKNTGKMTGAEVAQVYVHDNESALPRPEKELKEFAKVNLKPGESKRVTVTLDRDAFSYYNPDKQGFVMEPGRFTILVGNSSASLPLSGEWTATTASIK